MGNSKSMNDITCAKCGQCVFPSRREYHSNICNGNEYSNNPMDPTAIEEKHMENSNESKEQATVSYVSYYKKDPKVPKLPLVHIRNKNLIKRLPDNSLLNQIYLTSSADFILAKQQNQKIQSIVGDRIFHARVLSFSSKKQQTDVVSDFILNSNTRINIYCDNEYCYNKRKILERRFWTLNSLQSTTEKYMKY
eukprot:241069_1